MARRNIDFEGAGPAGTTSWALDFTDYAGFTWRLFSAFDETATAGTGYQARSGSFGAFNAFAGERGPNTMADDTPFTLKRGVFSAAWSDDLDIAIVAYRKGDIVGRVDFTVDYGELAKVKFGKALRKADELVFIATGGVDHTPDDFREGRQFAMDDLVLNQRDLPVPNVAAAPEPLVGLAADDVFG
jgi:hypothetical protein